MPTHLASLDSLVHPHQMEVQEFASYALVIDARNAEAYQEDHLLGAVNVPVAADRLADAQFTAMERGIAAVAGDAEPSMPYPLAVQVERLSPGDAVLVYCDRGGLDSLVWAGPQGRTGPRGWRPGS